MAAQVPPPVRRARRTGLRAKLFIALLVTTVPGLFVLGLYAHLSAADLLRDLMIGWWDGRAQILARTMAEPLRMAADDVRVLGQSRSVARLADGSLGPAPPAADLIEDVRREFAAVAARRRNYRHISYVGQEGAALVRVDPEGPWGSGTGQGPRAGLDRRLTERMRDLPPEGLYVSDLRLYRAGGRIEPPGRPSMRFATRVRSASGRSAGLVVIDLDAAELLSGLRSPDPGVELRVLDGQGFYALHPEGTSEWGGPDDRGTGAGVASEFAQAVAERVRVPLPAVIEDAGRIVVTQPVVPFGPQGSQWRVMLVAPSSLIDERVAASDFHRGFVLVAVACSVLPLAAGILLIGFFLRAVPKLQGAARAVAAGDLSHRVTIHSGDEMEDLAQDFNYMATRLTEYGQLERAIALEKLKDDLVHMIVHDLRTPLTGVLGTLQTIEFSDYDVDVTRDLVPGARRASVTLMGLINDLLDINKMEAGAMELDVARVETTAVVEEAIDMLRPLAEEKGLKLLLLECEGLPPMQADADKLRRIFVNLIGNAIKFTPSGGEVMVRAGGGYDGQALHFMVEDTGEGIPPEYLDRIFEKFGQVETRKAGRLVSTGLGLTFCKMAVEAHGGRIWVESTVGKGSTFHVELPDVPPPAAGPPAEESHAR